MERAFFPANFYRNPALRCLLAKSKKLTKCEALERLQLNARMIPDALSVRDLFNERAGVECVICIEIPRRVFALKIAQESRGGFLDPSPVLAALIADGFVGELDGGAGVVVQNSAPCDCTASSRACALA